MAACSVCGNEYDKAFVVEEADGSRRTFDSIECAAHAIAPTCEHCGCRILGHGVEVEATVYCCRHCAEEEVGASAITDRA